MFKFSNKFLLSLLVTISSSHVFASTLPSQYTQVTINNDSNLMFRQFNIDCAIEENDYQNECGIEWQVLDRHITELIDMGFESIIVTHSDDSPTGGAAFIFEEQKLVDLLGTSRKILLKGSLIREMGQRGYFSTELAPLLRIGLYKAAYTNEEFIFSDPIPRKLSNFMKACIAVRNGIGSVSLVTEDTFDLLVSQLSLDPHSCYNAAQQLQEAASINLSSIDEYSLLMNPDHIFGLHDIDFSLLNNLVYLKELELVDTNLSTLDGFEIYQNLEKLVVNHNQLTSLDSVSYLSKLNYLYADFNQLENIDSELFDLPDLRFVSMLGNKFESAPILPQSVEEVYLALNKIINIDNLKNYTLNNLEVLNLAENNISDISPLASVNFLKSVDLSGNEISNISELENLAYLSDLSLNGNTISDISPLDGSTSLKSLSVHGNEITSIASLYFPSLTGFLAGGNPLSSAELDGFLDINKDLQTLSVLGLNFNDADLSSLSSLSKLEYLDVSYNSLTHINFLTSIDLSGFWGSYNQFTSLLPLQGSSSLEYLNVLGNPIDSTNCPVTGPTVLTDFCSSL